MSDNVEFNLPDIGEGLHEAEVVEWLVAVGDSVERNQPFVEILTDKSQTEMPAPAAGTVVRLGASVGDIVHVGDLLIEIDDGGAGGAAGTTSTQAAEPASVAPPPEAPATASAATPAPPAAGMNSTGRRPKASPSTRRLAAELGVDLTTLRGTGPGSRILATDVQAAATSPNAAMPLPAVAPLIAPQRAANVTVLQPGHHPLRGIRRATAKAMDHSWSTIPHVTTMDEIDATELMLTRKRIREGLGEAGASVTPLALMVTAVARALRAYPVLNASLDLEAETIDVHADINIGIAVASERGLMVPVVRNADRLGVVALAHEMSRLAAAARDGSIRADDLSAGTCTVTNYGSNGGYLAAPIIRPGEAAIIGFGAIAERPFVVDGQVEARLVLPIVISADHRLIDGDVLSVFQAHLADSLTNAISLLVTST